MPEIQLDKMPSNSLYVMNGLRILTGYSAKSVPEFVSKVSINVYATFKS